MKKVLIILMFGLVLGSTGFGLMPLSEAGEPSGEPILQLETGMHTAMVGRIGVDAAGRYLVSASKDKTLRVWSLPELRLLNTLRVPIGAGDDGKLYATAISPDGNLIAAAGWTGYEWNKNVSIYLFNRATGQLQHRISGLGNVIFHLTFSPDGRHLAASLGTGQGVRVWRSRDWSLVGKDSDYGDSSYSCDFSQDGRLITTSFDGYLRLYDRHFKLQYKRKAAGGQQPYTASFSPDGGSIAVGFSDSTAVNVLNADHLGLLYAPDTRGVENGGLARVAWADGYLFAGGRWNVQGDINGLRRWSNNGRGSYRVFPVSAQTITNIRPLPVGGVVVASADPAITLLDINGNKKAQRLASIADMRGKLGESFQLSQDGRKIYFGMNVGGASPALFDLGSRQLTLSPPSPTDLHAPDSDSLSIKAWMHTSHPTLNGKPLKLDQYETSRSLAIAPNRRSFLLGTEWSLRRFDRQGKQLWSKPVPGVAWGVNISGDGKLAVAAFGDGTIRWYRYSDGELLLSFFPHKDGKRWVLWTPEGFFDHSEGGEKLIGYHLNQGKDRAAKFVTIDQVYNQFYRPDLVQKKLQGSFETEISDASAKVDINRIMAGGVAPTMSFLSPSSGKSMKQREVSVRVCARDEGGGMGRVVYRLNGMTLGLLDKGRGIKITGLAQKKGCTSVLERTFSLQPGKNIISVTAYNKNNEIESLPAVLKLSLKDAISEKPALHVLAVGVNKYRDKTLWLNYSVPDGKSLVGSMRASGSSIFTSVNITEIYDGDATLAGIEAAFKKISASAKSNDVFILYLAGHGMTLDGRYHFLPVDFRYRNEDSVRTSAINQDHIQRWMADLPAQKSLTLLDTCNSGSFVEAQAVTRGLAEKTAITKLIRATGRAVISASTDTQVAYEGYKGHGVFTYSLLQAMKHADQKNGNKDGVTSTAEIAEYVDEQVPDITYKKWGYEQVPQVNLHGRSFPVGVVQ